MARETKEIRKRLSGPEAAPYVGLARKLLGELKEGMAFAKLLQNERTVKLSDGTRVSVSSRFGQDEVRIEKPIFVPVVEEEERKEAHEPYIWIGVKVETGGMYTENGQDYPAGSLHLSVWEPGFDLEHPEKSAEADLLSNRSEGETNKEIYPLQDPLIETVGAYTVFRSRSNLLCFSDWVGEQYRKDPAKEELFDVVVVGDMDDLLETGFKWDPLYGNYTIKVCFVADECEEPTPVDFRLRICVGRDERSIVYDEVHHIDEASQYRFMYLPYGWFEAGEYEMDCFEPVRDRGKNPHAPNWWQDGAIILVPQNERQSVSIEQGLRPVGFEGGVVPDKGKRCRAKWTGRYVNYSSVGEYNIDVSELPPNVFRECPELDCVALGNGLYDSEKCTRYVGYADAGMNIPRGTAPWWDWTSLATKEWQLVLYSGKGDVYPFPITINSGSYADALVTSTQIFDTEIITVGTPPVRCLFGFHFWEGTPLWPWTEADPECAVAESYGYPCGAYGADFEMVTVINEDFEITEYTINQIHGPHPQQLPRAYAEFWIDGGCYEKWYMYPWELIERRQE